MCQIRVVVDKEDGRETLMENVTSLVVTPEGITLHTFFEEPRLVPAAAIANIDFLGGTVILTPGAPGPARAREEEK